MIAMILKNRMSFDSLVILILIIVWSYANIGYVTTVDGSISDVWSEMLRYLPIKGARYEMFLEHEGKILHANEILWKRTESNVANFYID